MRKSEGPYMITICGENGSAEQAEGLRTITECKKWLLQFEHKNTVAKIMNRNLEIVAVKPMGTKEWPKFVKKIKPAFASFRCSPAVAEQLLALMNHWGENQSRVIVRAICQAYSRL